MSSTNKTSNYELSQFLGTDKPAWLADYNSDMSKIDTQMKANADSASGADGKADANATAIGTLASLTTTAKTDLVSAINEVDGNADVANTVASTAQTTANTAKSTADSLASKFNFNSFTTYTDATAVTNHGSVTANVATINITLAKNTDGSLCKIYGALDFNSVSSAGRPKVKIIADSGLRPDTDLTITGTSYKTENATVSGVSVVCDPRGGSITIATDGAVYYEVNVVTANRYIANRLFACVIFVKDFGDTQE